MPMTNPPATTPTFKPEFVIGPHSTWPRRTRRRFIAPSILIGALGVFLHCALPLIA